MKYRVWHRTSYRYDDVVTDSLGIVHLTPRALPHQQVASTDLRIDPMPADLNQETDYFGNTATYFQVTAPHTELVVTATSEVDVQEPAYPASALQGPWEKARPVHCDDPDALAAIEFTLASPEVPLHDQARDYAAESLTPQRSLGEALTALIGRVHRDFAYQPGATTVTSTVAEVFSKRAGVCQDFAHLLVSGLRAHGLAVRYVSGYLATEPPPGRDRIVGADASHAWVEVWAPGGTWLAIDPTNDQWVNDRYVVAAWGRDYGDVPPLKGVIFSEARSSDLTVEVDVAPLI